MGTGSFPGVKYGRGVTLTTHSLLVPRSWKSRATPLLTLWATIGPVTGTLYRYLIYLSLLFGLHLYNLFISLCFGSDTYFLHQLNKTISMKNKNQL